LVPEIEKVTISSAGAALTAALSSSPRFDLILGGDEEGEEGSMAILLAAAWKIPFAGSALQVTVAGDKSLPSKGNQDRLDSSFLPNEEEDSQNMTGSDVHIVFMDATGKGQRIRALPAALCIEPGLSLREYTIADYLGNLNRNVELIRWPKQVPSRPVELADGSQVIGSTGNISRDDVDFQEPAKPIEPIQAAGQLLEELGLSGMEANPGSFSGPIEDVLNLPKPAESRARVTGVLSADAAGRLDRAAKSVLSAVQLLASSWSMEPLVVLLSPPEEELQRLALAQLFASYQGEVILLATPAAELANPVRAQWMIDCWPDDLSFPGAVIGEPWTETAFPYLAGPGPHPGSLNLRVREIQSDQSQVALITSRARGKLQARHVLDFRPEETSWITLTSESTIDSGCDTLERPIHVQRWTPNSEKFFTKRDVRRLLDELKAEVGVTRLADADFIVDVGFGVGNRDGYEAVIDPLGQTLHKLGVDNLVIGGSRKVTEELHLLPGDRQIGQSGVSVNPQILLAIGVSGAPQHLNYIGHRATIIAFNHDPEAPIMTLNQRQARPRVFPVVGDLFETVPAFIAALGLESDSHRQSG